MTQNVYENQDFFPYFWPFSSIECFFFLVSWGWSEQAKKGEGWRVEMSLLRVFYSLYGRWRFGVTRQGWACRRRHFRARCIVLPRCLSRPPPLYFFIFPSVDAYNERIYHRLRCGRARREAGGIKDSEREQNQCGIIANLKKYIYKQKTYKYRCVYIYIKSKLLENAVFP